MKITKSYLREIIKEALEDYGPEPSFGTIVAHAKTSAQVLNLIARRVKKAQKDANSKKGDIKDIVLELVLDISSIKDTI